MRNRILIADDESTLREMLAEVLRRNKFHVVTAADGLQAVQHLTDGQIDVALLDIRMPALDGFQVLAKAREIAPKTQIIMITAYGTVEDAVEAVKLGASDYVTKPIIFDDILIKIERLLDMSRLAAQNRSLMDELQDRYVVEGIVGASQAMRHVLEVARKLAQTRTSALITGESGTGKELAARAIHYGGVTKEGRFVAINCAALPESLAESELFGHKRGAFTGASRDRPGLFELADGGTILLDEISCMPLSIQAKLLRAIEEKCVLPIGGSEMIEINARILCATNRNLAKNMEAGTFREDLYYRLNVVEVHIPPLRERPEDIPPLVDHFIAKYNQELNRRCPGMSAQASQALLTYSWPGNVRELANVIERALIFAGDQTIEPENLSLPAQQASGLPLKQWDLRSALQTCERQHIMDVLRRHHFDKTEAARTLEIGLSSLYRKIEDLGIAKTAPADETGRGLPADDRRSELSRTPADDGSG